MKKYLNVPQILALKNALVLFIFLLVIPVSNYSQNTVSLEVTLKITKAPFTKRRVPTMVIIKNVGNTPVVIPEINMDNPNDYIFFEIIHNSTNTQVDFLEELPFRESGLRIASATEVLQPNAQKSYTLKINGFGSGLFGLANPNDPESIQKYTGFFNIRAKLKVDNFNLPTGGDITNVFRGTILSTPVIVFIK